MTEKKTLTLAQREVLNHRKPSGSPDGGQFTSFIPAESTQAIAAVPDIVSPDAANSHLRGLTDDEAVSIYEMLRTRKLPESLEMDRDDIASEAFLELVKPPEHLDRRIGQASTDEERIAALLERNAYFRSMTHAEQRKIAMRVFKTTVGRNFGPEKRGTHSNARDKAAYRILQEWQQDREQKMGRRLTTKEYEALAGELRAKYTAPTGQPFSAGARPGPDFHRASHPDGSLDAMLADGGSVSGLPAARSAEDELISADTSASTPVNLDVLDEAESRLVSDNSIERREGARYNSVNGWRITSEFYGGQLGISVDSLIASHPRLLKDSKGAMVLKRNGEVDSRRLMEVEREHFQNIKNLGGVTYLTNRWLEGLTTPAEEEALFTPYYRGTRAVERDEIRGAVAQIFENLSHTARDELVDGVWRNALHTAMEGAAKAHKARASRQHVAPIPGEDDDIARLKAV